jgi:hypothetical protein
VGVTDGVDAAGAMRWGALPAAADAIGHPRNWDKTIADRKIVRGVRTLHPESPGHVHLQREVVVASDAPVAADRKTCHQSCASPFGSVSGEVPETPSYDWAQPGGAKILLTHNRDSHVVEGERGYKQFGTAILPEPLRHHPYEAGAPETEAQPKAFLCRSRLRAEQGGPKGEERDTGVSEVSHYAASIDGVDRASQPHGLAVRVCCRRPDRRRP